MVGYSSAEAVELLTTKVPLPSAVPITRMVSIVEEKLRPLPTVRVPATVGAVLIVVRNTIGITVVAAFVDLPLIVKFKSPNTW
jgi:hypothetical protein